MYFIILSICSFNLTFEDHNDHHFQKVTEHISYVNVLTFLIPKRTLHLCLLHIAQILNVYLLFHVHSHLQELFHGLFLHSSHPKIEISRGYQKIRTHPWVCSIVLILAVLYRVGVNISIVLLSGCARFPEFCANSCPP